MAQFDYWNGHAEIEEKALQEEADFWKLSGYAATYDKDRVDDVIVPGAFKGSLERLAQRGDNLQLYFNHDLKAPPIGAVVECFEDRKGLKYEAHLPKDDTFVASRIVPQIKRRSLRSNSFGYKVLQSERRKSDNVRLLKAIDIFEISVVGIPANPAATIAGIKGLVPFQDLPIDRTAKTWDAVAALKRVTERYGESEELRRAFLFFDEEKGADARYLIADLNADGELAMNHLAVYKSAATLCGAGKGDALPEEAEVAVKDHLDRIYQRLSLDSPFKSLSVDEYKVLDVGEREARLRGLGVSRTLAKMLASSGQRDADRTPAPRDAVAPEDAQVLLNAFTSLMRQAARSTS